MFDSIRNHSKILMGLLFLLVIPSFVLFGIDSYSRFSDQGAPVARVAGNKITQAEWDAAHQREVERIRASVPNLDPKLLDSAEARYATLERIVNDRVIAEAAAKQLLITSDQRLARYLQQDPSIAGLRANVMKRYFGFCDSSTSQSTSEVVTQGKVLAVTSGRPQRKITLVGLPQAAVD